MTANQMMMRIQSLVLTLRLKANQLQDHRYPTSVRDQVYAALSASQVVYNNRAKKVTNDVGQINSGPYKYFNHNDVHLQVTLLLFWIPSKLKYINCCIQQWQYISPRVEHQLQWGLAPVITDIKTWYHLTLHSSQTQNLLFVRIFFKVITRR